MMCGKGIPYFTSRKKRIYIYVCVRIYIPTVSPNVRACTSTCEGERKNVEKSNIVSDKHGLTFASVKAHMVRVRFVAKRKRKKNDKKTSAIEYNVMKL